jgi:hypothetical protein
VTLGTQGADVLYKYLPLERLDVIENLEIRFSPLKSLNDPFESLPLVDAADKVDSAVKELLAELDQLWKETPVHKKTPENLKLLEQNKEAVCKGVESASEPSRVGEGLMDLLHDNFGVLSLSRTNISLLMWSHYTDSNAGYVIEFDDKHHFFKQKDLQGNIVRPMPVIYSAKRSTINDKHHNWYQKLLCEKPLDWAYEEEERLFITYPDKSRAIGKDAYDMDIILTDIPKEAISAIYLGYNSSKETEKRIVGALKKYNISKPILRANMSKFEYKIEFESIRSA